MAKKPDSTPAAEASAAPAAEVAAAPAETTSAIVPAASAAIAPVAEVSSAFAAWKALVNRLPEEARPRALMLKRPDPKALMDIVLALPEAKQEAMLALVSKTNPEKQGLHTSTTGFEPTALKVFHGVGNDPTRPRQTLPGQFYSGDARVIGEKFNAVPLAIYEGQILWPPKDQGGTKESKAPICVSVDRKTGSKYGSCAACPLNPETRQYTQGGCMREIKVYLLDDQLTSIYEMSFSKTSEGQGRSMLGVLKKSNALWDRWFTFEAKERVEKDRKWYVIQAGPLVDTSKPERANTEKELHPLFSALSKVIDADIYYPALANVHDRLKNNPEAGNAAAPGAAFDEKAFLKGDTEAAPDYSKDV